MEKSEIEDYLNRLKYLEKHLNDDDDPSYVEELDLLLRKLTTDISSTVENETQQYEYNLKIKIKKLHKDAVIPSYSKDGDAGMDLTATEILNETNNTITYGTGLSFEIPKSYVGLVFPRSSIRKYELQLSNSVGVIDSGYRGEVQATFNKLHHKVEQYKVGDRVAQIIILPYPKIQLVETDKLSDSERGDGGFGSTGT
jgi:dUTP pyrophosphatase